VGGRLGVEAAAYAIHTEGSGRNTMCPVSDGPAFVSKQTSAQQ